MQKVRKKANETKKLTISPTTNNKKMKKITITIIALLFVSQIFAQNITVDTTLANKYFETAKEYYKNKSYDTTKK